MENKSLTNTKEVVVTIVYKGEGELLLTDIFPNALSGIMNKDGIEYDALKVGDYVICVPAIKQ